MGASELQTTENERVQILFEELMRAPLTLFPPVKSAPLDVPNEQDVYVIEDANGNVLHVRTKNAQGGLQQRLYDHMYATSFGYAYVKEQGKVLCGVCRYRYVKVADARLRGFLENCAIGRLCPQHFGVG